MRYRSQNSLLFFIRVTSDGEVKKRLSNLTCVSSISVFFILQTYVIITVAEDLLSLGFSFLTVVTNSRCFLNGVLAMSRCEQVRVIIFVLNTDTLSI